MSESPISQLHGGKLARRYANHFLDFGVGAYRWPTFNVADIAVTCGAVALAVSFWREDLRRSAAASPG